jgi:hypothetical protein
MIKIPSHHPAQEPRMKGTKNTPKEVRKDIGIGLNLRPIGFEVPKKMENEKYYSIISV